MKRLGVSEDQKEERQRTRARTEFRCRSAMRSQFQLRGPSIHCGVVFTLQASPMGPSKLLRTQNWGFKIYQSLSGLGLEGLFLDFALKHFLGSRVQRQFTISRNSSPGNALATDGSYVELADCPTSRHSPCLLHADTKIEAFVTSFLTSFSDQK